MPEQIVFIDDGRSFEKFDANGHLLDLDDETMAAAAFLGSNVIGQQWYVPQVQWVKDFPGQVTAGRVGRPAIRFGPTSWLGSARQQRVESLINGKAVRDA